jgi:hypothetical protein
VFSRTWNKEIDAHRKWHGYIDWYISIANSGVLIEVALCSFVQDEMTNLVGNREGSIEELTKDSL